MMENKDEGFVVARYESWGLFTARVVRGGGKMTLIVHHIGQPEARTAYTDPMMCMRRFGRLVAQWNKNMLNPALWMMQHNVTDEERAALAPYIEREAVRTGGGTGREGE